MVIAYLYHSCIVSKLANWSSSTANCQMMLPKVKMSHPYRGLYTSLYESLPAEAVQDIERAIWFKITGKTDNARAVFAHDLKAFRDFPVVIIEMADLEFEAGRWGAAWRVLDSKLIELKEASANLDSPEHRLMALTRAMLGTRHRGDLAAAAHEIERTQSWLRDVPVTDYTDIQAWRPILPQVYSNLS